MARASAIVDCPSRPPCPVCGMNMVEEERIRDPQGYESCTFACLRCGHVEKSIPKRH